MAHDLNDADEQILSHLASGRNLPQNLADELDYSRQYVQNRLQMLKAADLVENLGGGLYEITDTGREEIAEEDDQKPNPPTRDVVDDYLWEHYDFGLDGLEEQLADQDDLRDALADAQRAEANLNRDNLEDALDRMEELLAGGG
ncbi:hypothetical protein [Halobacterium salinarum]|uniref:hypothetical protein n=1 Tax=Halobacterium salinarum TaxID=2242 RepID=UPI002555BF12|nr:hypothetical protein [Halobacterium salinarum]MDL0133545.1 hypothetical protein [Halobacterium salinarum]